MWAKYYCLSYFTLLLKLFQILFDNRYKKDQYNDCLLSVDGTDFQIPERGREWYSFKFKKSGLRYEVGLSIVGGEICWISGPYQPGLYNDLEIFRASFATYLDPFERVEADDGYVGEAPLQVKCPACVTIPEEREQMMKRVRSRQETINRRFKQWQILKQVFRHDIRVHRDVFASIAVITQLAINNGEALFSVDYSD